MNDQQIKARIEEITGEEMTDAQRQELWKLIVQVADFSYARGLEMERKLLRLKLGLQVPGDLT